MYTIIERIVPPGIEPKTFKLGLPTLKEFNKVYKAELIPIFRDRNDYGLPESAVCYEWNTRLSKTKKCFSIPVYYELKKFK